MSTRVIAGSVRTDRDNPAMAYELCADRLKSVELIATRQGAI